MEHLYNKFGGVVVPSKYVKDILKDKEIFLGRFVTEDASVLSELKKSLYSNYIKALFENLNKLGLTDEEIMKYGHILDKPLILPC